MLWNKCGYSYTGSIIIISSWLKRRIGLLTQTRFYKEKSCQPDLVIWPKKIRSIDILPLQQIRIKVRIVCTKCCMKFSTYNASCQHHTIKYKLPTRNSGIYGYNTCHVHNLAAYILWKLHHVLKVIVQTLCFGLKTSWLCKKCNLMQYFLQRYIKVSAVHVYFLSLIHIWRCRRSYACRSRWSPYH